MALTPTTRTSDQAVPPSPANGEVIAPTVNWQMPMTPDAAPPQPAAGPSPAT